MSCRLTNKEEIIRIGNEDTEFIRDNKKFFCCRWGKKQDNDFDAVLERKFGDFFVFSKTNTLQSRFEEIDKSDLPLHIKEYAKSRLESARGAWLDESYICTHDGVVMNDDDKGDWDFEYQDIQFDLKNSVLPRGFGNYRNSGGIRRNPEGFIRNMFLNGSDGRRAVPTFHKQSNRFFMVYRSKKDEDYFNRDSDRINTEFLKMNYKEKINVFDKIFEEFKKEEHVFNLKNVEYYYNKEKHIYDEVNCVICLVGEQKNGEIQFELIKKS